MVQVSDKARRDYWSSQMDAAYTFVVTMLERHASVVDCGEALCSLIEAADTAQVEVVFSSKPHVDDLPRLFFLRDGLISSFVSAARAMNNRGWIMRVEDGFRDKRMQANLGRHKPVVQQIIDKCCWEQGKDNPDDGLVFKRMAALIAYCPAVGTHMSGSAIDISVLDRASGEELDRGGPYIEMSERTPMASPFVSNIAQRNRQAISRVMLDFGFIAYPWEFWHYNSGDIYAEHLTQGQQRAKYGPIDWDQQTNTIQPIVNVTERLY